MYYVTWIDYVAFFGMLIVSALIGIYFAYFAPEKQNTVGQYLMGGKTMGVFPISMSLIASFISGISILGFPAEMYVYGTQFSLAGFAWAAASIPLSIIYLPVYFKLQITSSYDYLEKRFGYSAKFLGAVLFIIKQMLYIPIVIYVPALAFNQVTGMNLHLVTPIVCAICIFYTCVGGIKAVVWTDTFQILIMMIGLVVVLFIGVNNLRSADIIFEKAAESGRLEFFNLDLDPRTRVTFWNTLIGDFFLMTASCSVNQAIVQRCLCLPNLHQARTALKIFALGIIVIVALCSFTGLVIYATFSDCDPIIIKVIKKPDQLLPLFVSKIAPGKIPGLAGIFLSGVFSASLSTMSTGLNSMTGVVYEDMIKAFYKKEFSETEASNIMKAIVLLLGLICVILVFVIEQMGSLIEISTSLGGVTSGALLGIFTLGMFLPWVNEKGVLCGGICSLLIMAWISINSQVQISLGNISYAKKPVSIMRCSQKDLSDPSLDFTVSTEKFEAFFLYAISYFWYTSMGAIIAAVIGVIASYFFGFNNSKHFDKDLLTPMAHWFLPKIEEVEMSEIEGKEYTLKDASSDNGQVLHTQL